MRPVVAYSPDGKLLAAVCGVEGPVVWDVDGGAVRWRATRADPRCWDQIAFSPDGRILAAVVWDNKAEKAIICFWEVASGKIRREVTGRLKPIQALAFSPDGSVLATGGKDGVILLWDVTGLRSEDVRPEKTLRTAELDGLWSDLASADAVAAGRAVTRLAAAPPTPPCLI